MTILLAGFDANTHTPDVLGLVLTDTRTAPAAGKAHPSPGCLILFWDKNRRHYFDLLKLITDYYTFLSISIHKILDAMASTRKRY